MMEQKVDMGVRAVINRARPSFVKDVRIPTNSYVEFTRTDNGNKHRFDIDVKVFNNICCGVPGTAEEWWESLHLKEMPKYDTSPA